MNDVVKRLRTLANRLTDIENVGYEGIAELVTEAAELIESLQNKTRVVTQQSVDNLLAQNRRREDDRRNPPVPQQ